MKNKFFILPLLAMMLIGSSVFAQVKRDYASVLQRVNGNQMFLLIDYQDSEHGYADGVIDEIVTIDLNKDYPLFKDNVWYSLAKVQIEKEPKEASYVEIVTQDSCMIISNSQKVIDHFYACNYAKGEMTFTTINNLNYTIDGARKVEHFTFPG